MFEKELTEIRILSNWADAQGMNSVRDYLRRAASEAKCVLELRASHQPQPAPAKEEQ